MNHLVIAELLWSMLATALILTFVGFALRSWKVLWLAAVLSLLFTVAAALSIGPLTLLILGLQLASAVAYRWDAGVRGWLALLSSAGLIWLLSVPAQLAFGPAPFLFVLIPIGILAAVVATVIGPSFQRNSPGSA
jgi:hypothetical protein